MIKSTAQRQKAVNAALGSVKAEGLKPSRAVQRDLRSFATGKYTLETVRKNTILRISSSAHPPK